MGQRDFTDRAPFCLSLYHVSPINLVSHFTTSLCPSSGYLTNALHEGDRPVNSDFGGEYQDIFINVKDWGAFDASDISRNGLRIYVDGVVPDFVAKFEVELDSKPRLAPDVCCFLGYSFDTNGY